MIPRSTKMLAIGMASTCAILLAIVLLNIHGKPNAGRSVAPSPKIVLVPSAQPPVANEQPQPPASDTYAHDQKILRTLAIKWDKTSDFARDITKVPYQFPNDFDPGHDWDVFETATSTFVHFLSIPTHSGSAILRVYLGCTAALLVLEPSPSTNWISEENSFYACGDWMLQLKIKNVKTGRVTLLGTLTPESRTGNSGGLYMPFAFTRDDRRILLDAWMGSPGAGGGLVDYGFAFIPSSPTTTELVRVQRDLSPRQSFFYDSDGMVVFAANSDRLPSYSQPGPMSNDGVIKATNLATLKTTVVLEEPDTTYELMSFNEAKKTLRIRATLHRFSQTCPRGEDALYCTAKTTQERTIPLP